MAQEYDCTVISPYQIDASGEARFAKGILDAADAAFTLDTHDKEGDCITFNCTKNEIFKRSKLYFYDGLGNSKDRTRKCFDSQRGRSRRRKVRRIYTRPLIKIFLDTPVDL